LAGVSRAKELPADPALAVSLNEKALTYLRILQKEGAIMAIGTNRDAQWMLAA